MPVFASHNWFVAVNTVAMIVAACLLVRLFGFSLTSVALPALLLAMFCTESVTNTIVFTNINGGVLLAEVLFFRWLLTEKVSDQWWAGAAIGLSLVVKPVLAVLLLLPLLNRQWRVLVTAFAVPLVFNAVAWPLVGRPDEFREAHAALYCRHPRLLQQFGSRQRYLLRAADMVDPTAPDRDRGAGWRSACGCCTGTTGAAIRSSGC